jgi:NAD(P)-dependent dehydrogenase (short-subunit alcohol dehydrogenase family)
MRCSRRRRPRRSQAPGRSSRRRRTTSRTPARTRPLPPRRRRSRTKDRGSDSISRDPFNAKRLMQTKAFIDSFSWALRAELKHSGVTVTCLMPGATETELFARADMLDTKVGQQAKDDPADVARSGFDAMLRGDGDVVSGWKNKLQAAVARATPASILAEEHRK